MSSSTGRTTWDPLPTRMKKQHHRRSNAAWITWDGLPARTRMELLDVLTRVELTRVPLPASRREGTDRVTWDGATRDRLPARMTEKPRRRSDAGWLTRVVPVHFYPSRNLSLVGF
ncbi:hypothetical protein F2Q69_00030292 [Brassica cretica]|uniref:Uncharacterized protein n=1 Tax=Brassica cretica TaxID=69181 RepID=A0A8S9RWY4_BRACR|nr:hypothetical protein F2Q69_00030292 [Brassica cretica]